MGRTQCPAGVTSSTVGWLCSRLALLTLLAVGCWLLADVIADGQAVTGASPPTDQQRRSAPSAAPGGRTDAATWSDAGRYRGRPVRQLWAANLPEQAWFTDNACRHFVTRFTRDDALEVVRLASFPRSGNTWARYLLETATGLFTSSGGPNYSVHQKYGDMRLTHADIWKFVYGQQAVELTRMGYLGELGYWTQGNTILQKTHNLPQPWNATEAAASSYEWAAFADDRPRRAILVVRDPFKAFISLRTYSDTQSVLDGGHQQEDAYRGESWELFVAYYAQHWYDLNAQWVQQTNDTLVVVYEQLQRAPLQTLDEMLAFLEFEPDPERIACVRRHLDGRAHNRKHDVVPNDVIYPLRLRAEVWSHIHQLNNDLKDRGLRELPLKQYSFAEEFSTIGV